jgi:uncharacterized protein YqgV (UPF0045/DUF77 family)
MTMQVSCQFSVYPLGVDPLGPAIEAAIAALAARGLHVETGPMSSTVTGPVGTVLARLAQIFEDDEPPTVVVATISNACPASGSPSSIPGTGRGPRRHRPGR